MENINNEAVQGAVGKTIASVALVADGTDAFGNPKFRERDITGRVTLDKGRTRAVYKALKRDYLREARCSHA